MFIQPASRLGNVEEYYFSRKLKEIAAMRAAGMEVINLGIGSPDLPPSPSVIQVLQEEAAKKNSHKYQGYTGLLELREAFSASYKKWYGVELNPDNEVLPLMGSKEGIMHISMTYLEAGDEVLIPNPGYPTYSAVAKLTGATSREYLLSAENNWLPDLAALAKEDLSKVKMMWVNYPHMPTGAKADKGFFKELIAFAKAHKILICNDNPYSFILNDQYLSLLSVDGAKEVALELNSLSKSHNMAGWRVGVLAGKEDYVQTVLRFKSNMDSGMFRPVQLAAAKALTLGNGWFDSLNAVYKKRQRFAYDLLSRLGCRYVKNVGGMFVWARIPKYYKNGFNLSNKLLEKSHVFITPGGIFGSQGDNYVRISLCSKEEDFMKAQEKLNAFFR